VLTKRLANDVEPAGQRRVTETALGLSLPAGPDRAARQSR
jgi:hypothetical protein